MSVQYISDSKGKTTGVFIPVREWEKLKEKYEGLEETAEAMPEWHKQVVRERLAAYKANPSIAVLLMTGTLVNSSELLSLVHQGIRSFGKLGFNFFLSKF